MGKLFFKSFSILWDVFTILFYFLFTIFTPDIMEQPSIHDPFAPKVEFSKPSSPTSSSYELDPGFIAMVRKSPFFGVINEGPLLSQLKEAFTACPCFEEAAGRW